MDDVIKLENQFMICRFIYHAKLSNKVKLLYSGLDCIFILSLFRIVPDKCREYINLILFLAEPRSRREKRTQRELPVQLLVFINHKVLKGSKQWTQSFFCILSELCVFPLVFSVVKSPFRISIFNSQLSSFTIYH
jgi:hypothetical protein